MTMKLKMRKTTRTVPIEVQRSMIHGRGVFATRRIRKGQRIVEYRGHRITEDEADRKYGHNGGPNHYTLLFKLNNGKVIDASRGGNIARFINHSCGPNCEAVEEDGRIYIEAVRNIQAGVELTYDYQFEGEESLAEARRLYPCRCGTKNCRGTIVKK